MATVALARGKVVNTIGKSEWVSNGNMWDHPAVVRYVICPQDGDKRHTVYLGQDADTWFSWPGRARWGGRWHRGMIITGCAISGSHTMGDAGGCLSKDDSGDYCNGTPDSVFTCHDCYNGKH